MPYDEDSLDSGGCRWHASEGLIDIRSIGRGQIHARLRRMAGTKSGPFWRHGVLLRRTGRGRDAPLTVLGVMRRRVNIGPRLDAVGVVGAAVHASFGPVYERLLLKWAAST